jgi:hypothetical protein
LDAYSPIKGDHDQMVAPLQVGSELINIIAEIGGNPDNTGTGGNKNEFLH